MSFTLGSLTSPSCAHFSAVAVLSIVAAKARAEPVEVTVSSSRPAPFSAPRARAVSGSVLEGERLRQPGRDAADALREAPGVQITQTGGLGAPATASLRGATSAQTPVYLGGVRINDEVGGAANLSDIPLFLVERVEIYRSHAPLATDRLGIGGAILFEPKKPRQNEGAVLSLVGSYGARGLSGYTSVAGENQGVLIGAELAAADNDYPYFDDRGTLYVNEDGGPARLRNADAALRTLWLVADERVGRARVEVVMNHAAREQGATKLALVPAEHARVSFSRDLVAVQSVLPADALGGEVRLVTAATQGTTTIDDPASELGLLTTLSRTPGEHVEQTVRVVHGLPWGILLVEQISASIERLRRFARQNGQLEEELSARRFSARPAASVEVPLGRRWSLSGIGALDCWETSRARLGACGTVAPIGRAGAAYRARTHEVYANAGRYRRLPTLSELYGASLLVRGNPELDAETGYAAEIGVRVQAAAPRGRPVLWAEAAVFARWTEDLVTFVRTAQGYLHPLNRDSARAVGGELAMGSAPVRALELSGALSLLDARDTSRGRATENDVLPFSSRLGAWVLATVGADVGGTFVERAGFAARVEHRSNRFADPAGLGVIPAQTTCDVDGFVALLEGHLVVRGRIANAFGARRFDVVGLPLPGRSAFLSAEATW